MQGGETGGEGGRRLDLNEGEEKEEKRRPALCVMLCVVLCGVILTLPLSPSLPDADYAVGDSSNNLLTPLLTY